MFSLISKIFVKNNCHFHKEHLLMQISSEFMVIRLFLSLLKYYWKLPLWEIFKFMLTSEILGQRSYEIYIHIQQTLYLYQSSSRLTTSRKFVMHLHATLFTKFFCIFTRYCYTDASKNIWNKDIFSTGFNANNR